MAGKSVGGGGGGPPQRAGRSWAGEPRPPCFSAVPGWSRAHDGQRGGHLVGTSLLHRVGFVRYAWALEKKTTACSHRRPQERRQPVGLSARPSERMAERNRSRYVADVTPRLRSIQGRSGKPVTAQVYDVTAQVLYARTASSHLPAWPQIIGGPPTLPSSSHRLPFSWWASGICSACLMGVVIERVQRRIMPGKLHRLELHRRVVHSKQNCHGCVHQIQSRS